MHPTSKTKIAQESLSVYCDALFISLHPYSLNKDKKSKAAKLKFSSEDASSLHYW